MRTWRVLLHIPVLACLLIALVAPPVSAATVPSAPSNIRLTVKSGNDLKVKYDKPDDDGGAGIKEYRLRFAGRTFSVGKKRDVDIKDLDDGLYSVEVSARNKQGWGPWGRSNQVRIGPELSAPGQVRELRTSVGDNDAILVSWKQPKDSGGTSITNYVLRVEPGFERWLGSDDRSTVLEDFDPGNHTIFVSAVNKIGEGPAASSRADIDGPPEPRVGPFLNANSFVDQQYEDLFSRSADESGRQFWLSQIADDGSNGAAVIVSMMGATEFLPSYQAIRLYLAYFNRLPDNAGLNYWVEVLKRDGAPLAAVSDSFAASREFRLTYGSLSDRDFVALVYNNVLIRTSDAGGFNYWTDQLRNGLTRGEMMILFSDSAEFVRNSNPAVQTAAIYNAMLDRSPTAQEFQQWLRQIGADPAARQTLVQQIFDSGAYRSRIN
jgi:hypothetical protein